MKVCRKCGLEKPGGDFYKHPTNKDRLMSNCKTCHGISSAQWKRENPERAKLINKKSNHKNIKRVLSASKEWKKRNPEKVKRYSKIRYLRHKEKILQQCKQWNINNPEKVKEIRQKYAKKSRELLLDSYLKRLIIQDTILKKSDIPMELIDFKRTQVQLKRLIKENPYGQHQNSK